MKCGTDIKVPLRMKCRHFDDLLNDLPPSGQNMILTKYLN